MLNYLYNKVILKQHFLSQKGTYITAWRKKKQQTNNNNNKEPT